MSFAQFTCLVRRKNPITNKQWRNSIYQYLAGEGFSFNRERHKMLKQLLNARSSEDDDFDNFEPDEELETDDRI